MTCCDIASAIFGGDKVKIQLKCFLSPLNWYMETNNKVPNISWYQTNKTKYHCENSIDTTFFVSNAIPSLMTILYYKNLVKKINWPKTVELGNKKEYIEVNDIITTSSIWSIKYFVLYCYILVWDWILELLRVQNTQQCI